MPNYSLRCTHKTRTPRFPQLETTEPLKKLKIGEKKIPKVLKNF